MNLKELKQELKQEMCKTILGIGLPAALSVSATVLFNEISMEFGKSSVPSFIVGAGVGALSMAWARRAPAHVFTNRAPAHFSTKLENVTIVQQSIGRFIA